jgi:DNA-binding CsgD family transcriptional regulator
LTDEADVEGWFFLKSAAVPDRWRDRAVQVFLVPVTRTEAAHLLGGGRAEPEMEPADEPLAALTARGLSTKEIALALKVSHRHVERRLAALRERFGVDSKATLALHLARRGFGEVAGGPPSDVGGTQESGANE